MWQSHGLIIAMKLLEETPFCFTRTHGVFYGISNLHRILSVHLLIVYTKSWLPRDQLPFCMWKEIPQCA